MPREHPRSRRVAEQIQRIVAEAIRADLRDPRVAHAVITHVEVAPDLGSARVYFARLDGAPPDAGLAAGLASAAGFLRSRLAAALATRTVPELRFVPDETSARARRLDDLIDAARTRDGPGDGTEPPERDP
jgi:ribosome-binding factor A